MQWCYVWWFCQTMVSKLVYSAERAEIQLMEVLEREEFSITYEDYYRDLRRCNELSRPLRPC